MNALPTKHALLRDRLHWDGSAAGLAFDGDGIATLMPVPAPPAPVALPGPYGVPPSGVACLSCSSEIVADSAHGALVLVDGQCGTRTRIAGGFDAPRGLAFVPGRGLYVADCGNGRVMLLRDPTLELVATWPTGFADPCALAVDSLGRLYVVGAASGLVVRLAPDGTPDIAYAGAMPGVAARFIAIGAADTLHVATIDGRLLRFAPDASPLPALAALDPALAAGALAISGDRLVVADTATGRVAVLDRATGATLARLPRFAGPVTALACCDDGSLLLKARDDDAVLRCPQGAVAASGTIDAGPVDAGERDAWFVALAEADVPPGAAVDLALFASDSPTPAPGAGDWRAAPASSVLVANLFPGVAARYLWLRVTLRSDDALATPRLRQVRAETPGEDYLDELPAIYRNADSGFLARLVAALRVQFDASERRIDDWPQRLSAGFAPSDELAWLAGWLGFELPAGLDAGARRALLGRIVTLHGRRGTPAGLAELVQVYTGVRPRIVEAWRERHLWQLGTDSVLGFDTGLAPALPAGMVVPDPAAGGCAPPTVGAVVVGASGPLAADDFGTTLFADTAHRFTVSVPAFHARGAALRDAIRRVVEREKPAHTDVALCFVEPEMRVGMQALLGVDTYVADAPAGASLAGMTLDLDARLAGADGVGRIASNAGLGIATRLG